MALNYELGKILNFKQVCFRNSKMNPVTHALIFATMAVGLNEITKQKWKKFYSRLHVWEKVNGTYLTKNGLPIYITAEEVKEHIGLSTNASQTTALGFLKNFSRKLSDIEQSIDR